MLSVFRMLGKAQIPFVLFLCVRWPTNLDTQTTHVKNGSVWIRIHKAKLRPRKLLQEPALVTILQPKLILIRLVTTL